jgi:TolB protein
MNADGTGQRNLTADNDNSDGAPVWSLDGHNIAFSRRFDGRDHIFVMDSDGGNLKRVTRNFRE